MKAARWMSDLLAWRSITAGSKVLAEDEMRVKQAFLKLRKSVWLMLPRPLGSS